MIVVGYQGIGKSTLSQKSFKYIDLESSALRKDDIRWHNWYEPYCMIAEWLSKQGDTVFVSSHKEVRDYLNKFCKEPFCAVVPSENLKDEWINKLRKRYKQFPTDKNYRAYMNAVDRFTENIREIKNDIKDTREIKSMTYELYTLIADIPQTNVPRCSVNGTPYDECGFCEYFNCDTCQCEADITKIERSYKKEDVVRVVENVKRGYGLTKSAEDIVAEMQIDCKTCKNGSLTWDSAACNSCGKLKQTDCGLKQWNMTKDYTSIKWTGDNYVDVCLFMGREILTSNDNYKNLIIYNSNNPYIVSVGDYIIKDKNSNYYIKKEKYNG